MGAVSLNPQDGYRMFHIAERRPFPVQLPTPARRVLVVKGRFSQGTMVRSRVGHRVAQAAIPYLFSSSESKYEGNKKTLAVARIPGSSPAQGEYRRLSLNRGKANVPPQPDIGGLRPFYEDCFQPHKRARRESVSGSVLCLVCAGERVVTP